MKTILSIALTIALMITAYIWGFNDGMGNNPTQEEKVASSAIYGDYTGYDLFNAANDYRVANGLKPLILHQPLCNNISQRWQNYIRTDSHDGLQEFAEEFMPQEGVIWEILAPGSTAQEAVKNWSGSPSHDLALKNNNKGCAYAAKGRAVMLLSK